MTDRHVVVVGGGIAGLAAAHALLVSSRPPRVTVFEASDQLGGKIRTSPFAGLGAVDEGADAFLARVPWATELAEAVGLEQVLTSPAVQRASIWMDGLHDLPEGLLLGMPTDLASMARSGLFGWQAKLRAATEPLRRRTSTSNDSLGQFVRARFGDQVHERLVDPLVGSIYAADTDRFSLAAVAQIAELAMQSRSILLAARRRPAAPSGPVFYAPTGGVGQLIAATADVVRRAGGNIATSTPVHNLDADGQAWRVNDLRADDVILACPAATTDRLIGAASHAGGINVAGFGQIEAADVVLVTLAIPAAQWPAHLLLRSGYLVPKSHQRLVTAVSFGSSKWQHWRSDDQIILRISLGRDGLPVLHLTDQELLAAAVDEVGSHLGIDLQPVASRISRWPAAFPQYRPHHAALVASIERALPRGIHVAGASYHGIGIPACVRSGSLAADAIQSGQASR